MNKRRFLKNILVLGLGAGILPNAIAKSYRQIEKMTSEEAATYDEFWELIRKKYHLKTEYINLENGYYCIMPEEILESQIRHLRELNSEGSYYMRKNYETEKKAIIKRLAKHAHCGEDELVITRNTTESLDLVIGGLDWKKGDEAIMALEDYGAMLNHFRLQAERHGVVNKTISVPLNPENDEEVVKVYEEAITDKTRLIMVCHMINITGHILPVRKICDMAHRYGVEVMVDGAHSFAQIPTSMKELGCDYFGTSLHKWLSSPLGCGFLYIKKEKIAGLWPLFAEDKMEKSNIYRLNHTGTRPVHSMQGINAALDFYEWLGAERKEKRLRYLQNYWTDKVRGIKKITLNTPEDKKRSCGIANVAVAGYTPEELAEILFEKYTIWTVAINRPTVKGCRITLNIYTSTEELDNLVKALKELTKIR